jgi:hypothetical protein
MKRPLSRFDVRLRNVWDNATQALTETRRPGPASSEPEMVEVGYVGPAENPS